MYHLQRIKVLLATCMLACASLWAQDTKIAISGATADSYHRDYGASKAIDGRTDTYWHSGNNSSGYNTTFPVTFTITLNQATHVDYVRYYPRTDSSNGHWDAVTVSYCSTTTGSSFTTLGSYTLNGAGSTFDFPIGKTCGQVKFTINSGRGGWATASEIEAYAYNTEKMAAFAQYFTDGLYTQLKSGVTSSNGIADADVKALVASMLENATEYKKFRVGEYEPYMTTATVQRNLKTANLYNNYENPTGIYLKVGESCIVAVSGINGNYPVGLKIKDWYKSGDLSSYSLHNGLNYITATTEGNVFVDYYTDDFENAPNVQMHFINAPVLGYWDQATMTNGDWVSMLEGPLAEDDVIIITRSEHAQTAYPVKQWKQYCLDNVNATMTNYQNVQWALRDIMGLVKFNRQVKNRQLFYADQSGSMYAGGDASVCGYGDLRVLVTPDAKNFDFWGVGHEWGHNNQMPGFHWTGCTETTNNIPASWAQIHFTGHRDSEGKVTNLRLEDEVTGINDYKDMRGGRMQTYFEEGLRKGVAWQLQDGPDYHGATGEITIMGKDADGNDTEMVTTSWRNYDHFVKLSPFWQLNLWGTLANKCPDIIPTVIERIRATENYTATYNTNGKQQINWMKLACDAAQINLLPFFEKAGMLRPIHAYIEDYNRGWNIITEEMINELKTYVAGKNYPDYTEEINYINGHNYHIYRDGLKLNVTGMQGVLNGDKVTIQHSVAQNAVAFETYNAKDELIRITMYGLGSDDTHSYTQVLYPSSFDQSENAAYIMAVGYDGRRQRVYQTYANEAEAIYGELGRLLASVEAMQELCDNNKVGYYKATALTDLNTAYEIAKVVYDNQESASYETVYDALCAEYEKVQNNKYARVGIVEGNAYRLENKGYKGRYMSINSEKMIVGETTDLTDEQKWYFEASDTEGYYYIKNKSTQTYPGNVETSKKLYADKITSTEAHAYKLQDMGNGLWALVGGTGLHQGSDVYNYGIVGWEAEADASQWYITAVEISADAEALNSLKALIQETKTLMGHCGTINAVEASENSMTMYATAGNYPYLSCPNLYNPNQYTTNGGDNDYDCTHLLDGNNETYIHTNYATYTYNNSGVANTYPHHLQIDFGADNTAPKNFKFTYRTRKTIDGSANQVPMHIEVQGSTDGTTFTALGTFKSTDATNPLPTTQNTEWTSNITLEGKGYRYLRFVVKESAQGTSKPYFAMAEFGLIEVINAAYNVELKEAAGDASVDQLLATYEQWEAAKEVSQNATSVEQVQEAIYNLTAAKEALSAAMQTNNKAALRDLIASTTALINECGTITYHPATLDGELALQASNPNGNWYVSTNADQNTGGGTNDGQGIAALVDNNTSTSNPDNYFHTRWGGTVLVNEDHYIQVDMGAGVAINDFVFSYMARNGSPAPTEIKIKGSNDGSKFVEITSVTKNWADYNQNRTYTSGTIVSDEAYRYLRFEVTKSNGPGNETWNGHYFFGMREFYLTAIGRPESYTAELGAEAGEATTDLLLATYHAAAAAQVVYDDATTKQQLSDALNRLQAQYDALFSAKYPSVEFTISVEGDNGNGGVVYKGVPYTTTLSAPEILTVEELTAIDLTSDGYVAKNVTLNGRTITVTYNKVYTIYINGGEGNGRITLNGTEYANESTFDALKDSFTAEDLTASDVEGYTKSAVSVDHETGNISVTYTLDKTALNDLLESTQILIITCQGFVNSEFVTQSLLNETNTAWLTAQAALETVQTRNEYTAVLNDLQTAYNTLDVAKSNAIVEANERTELNGQLTSLISETETLITSCYENGTLKYVNSDYVTEASIAEIRSAIEAARAKCNSNGTTESEYNASLETLGQMKSNLATAIENANNEAAARDEKRAELNTLIAAANELITLCATTPGDATDALIAEVSAAVTYAGEVASYKGSTVEALTTATVALQAKYDVLSAAQQSTAKAALRALIAQTTALIEECGVVVNGRHPVGTTPVALQTTDKDAAYYLSTNAQQSGEGPIANLLDGSTGSYFHSNWSSQVGEAHRLQVDMGAGHTLKEFAFSYTTRDNGTGGPHPSTIVVSGSNSLDETFVELATINSGLPTTGNTAWNTANENVITASEAYRFLRFTVTASAGTNGCKHGNNEYFFAMSEFSLSPIIYETSYFVESMLSYGNVTEEQLIDVAKARDAAEKLAEESYDKTALEAQAVSLQTLYQALLVAHNDYSYLPVTLTTNMETPVLYVLNSKRGNTKVLQYEPADEHMFSIADATTGTAKAKQLFYFTKGTKHGQVFIHPFAAGEQVLAAENTSNATAAVWATPKGTMTHQEWTIPVVNRENGTYNIKAADGSNYFSNNSGVDYKMGFWSGSNTTDPGSLFTFTLAQIEGSSAYYSLQVYCDEALKEFTNKQPGYYGANPEFEEACARAEALLSGTADYATYLEAYHALRIANETPVIILPEEGKFYRIKNNGGTGYLSSGTGTGRTQFVADIGDAASSIFYYTGGKLLSFANGMYLANNGDFLCYTNTAGAGTTITFKESPVEGKLLIEFKGNNGDRSFYSAGTGNSDAATSGQTGDSYRFTVEEVTSLPVTISKIGFATFYTPVALAIPEDVSAYVGTLNDSKDELTLTDVNEKADGIPAETGVVLYRAEGRTESTTHYFDIVDDLEPVESAFEGNVETVAKGSSSPYTLQTHNGGVAFKLFTGDNVTGFKAYLDFTEAKAQAIRIRFGKNEGTTEIEPSTLNSQPSTEAYDLMGRRVLNPMKGMYIVDGKKVIF